MASTSLKIKGPSNGQGKHVATAVGTPRTRHMHMLYSEDELYRLRMVASDNGMRMADLVREILHVEVDRRFVEMSRRLGPKK